MASSKSSISTASLSFRAANRAASFTTFARSAPTNPDVRWAMVRRSTLGLKRTCWAERVQFVDEDNARGDGLGLRKQIAHARGPDTDEHLDEFRPIDREEW